MNIAHMGTEIKTAMTPELLLLPFPAWYSQSWFADGNGNSILPDLWT